MKKNTDKITKLVLIDITGTELKPGNFGKDCLGNGEHLDANGKIIECCCDECDYLQCCINKKYPNDCINCPDEDCPRKFM